MFNEHKKQFASICEPLANRDIHKINIQVVN